MILTEAQFSALHVCQYTTRCVCVTCGKSLEAIVNERTPPPVVTYAVHEASS